jgi:antitoxin VapB
MEEFDRKLESILALLERTHLDALVLQNVSSFAWATCGAASYVNTAATQGAATLLITPTRRHVITNNIEAARLKEEEKLDSMGWEFHITPWHVAPEGVVALAPGLKLGADVALPGTVDLSAEVARLRARLTVEEGERFRVLGRLCAEAMNAAIRAVRPGLSEHEIAAILGREAESQGVQAIVNLIATDERIFRFRHPLPTPKILDRYAMLVLCGRRRGLVCSITRLVQFGPMPKELRDKMEACARVDAAIIQATRPGETLGGLFRCARQAYESNGFPDEWRLHHQGGPAGYEPREQIATPDSNEPVILGQAFAWNPSITGVKSEDTILVGPSHNEVLTTIEGWPMISVVGADGEWLERPAILEIA